VVLFMTLVHILSADVAWALKVFTIKADNVVSPYHPIFPSMALQSRVQSKISQFLDRMRRQVQDDSALFLHYDSQVQDLRPWFWYVIFVILLVDGIYSFSFRRPIINGQRVTPEDLLRYRRSHGFRNPCCFCAAKYLQIAYTESELQLILHGPYSGEWVVRCETNGYGYFGKQNFIRLSVWLVVSLIVESP
jgi:hypothetical protein